MSYKKMCLLAATALMLTDSAWSQWTKQEIVLRPGWNAVFLYVQPEPSDCDTLFASAPFTVESVRAYNSAFSSVQYIQDMNSLIPSDPPWIAWVPSNATERFANTLFRLDCGKAYFIKLPDGASTTTWNVVGKPVRMDIDWRADACNLVGFQLDETNPPSFAQVFFGFARSRRPADLSDERDRRLGTGDKHRNRCGTEKPFGFGSTSIPLIRARRASKRIGAPGLDYGRTLIEQPLRIRNEFTNAMTIRLRKVTSDDGAGGRGTGQGGRRAVVLLDHQWLG